MNHTLPATQRNQTLDCIRMIACTMVVFAHVPFPGALGEWNSCLFRFAVPFFFAVSGYFSYGTSARKLTGRLLYILKLNVFAIGISLLCDLAAAWGSGEDLAFTLKEAVPTVDRLARWVFLHVNPFGGHLWYLTAAAVCYGIAALYIGFFREDTPDCKMLYASGFFLFLLRFAGADILAFGDVKLPYWLFRDGIFLGFPMFAMGMFLRQYESRILSAYRLTAGKLLGLLALGIGLSVLQWKGLSIQELPLGAVVQTGALILLSRLRPTVTDSAAAGKCIAAFRSLSTWVYIIHLPLNKLYGVFAQGHLTEIFGSRERWVHPVAVLTVSILVCLPVILLHGRARSGKKG